jgi:hypothetical protein
MCMITSRNENLTIATVQACVFFVSFYALVVRRGSSPVLKDCL